MSTYRVARRTLSEIARILRGISCGHSRMRYVSCGHCPAACRVECPDCGLTWMLYEDING